MRPASLLITPVARVTSDPSVKTGANEANEYSDSVSINVYGNNAKSFIHRHNLYPQSGSLLPSLEECARLVHTSARIKDVTDAADAMKG